MGGQRRDSFIFRTSARRARRAGRRAEARLRTGPAAHLLGGALDVLGALGRYSRARRRRRR
ncbi:MAG TPA: hypothetical protein VNV44_05350 [Solirubrobacteraceae bacterium]|nr:hypothetical protein [Solirubrobacteraceae bacterium]